MKKTIISIAAVLLITSSTSAISMELTSYAAPSQPGNSGDATILDWVNSAINGYNGAHDPDLPSPAVSAFRNNQGQDNGPSGTTTFGDGVTNLNIFTTGYEYLALHWGGKKDKVVKAEAAYAEACEALDIAQSNYDSEDSKQNKNALENAQKKKEKAEEDLEKAQADDSNLDPNYQVFYLGGDSNLVVDNSNDGNGLSWYELFNAEEDNSDVPDSGTTLALLGAALLALVGFRARKN